MATQYDFWDAVDQAETDALREVVRKRLVPADKIGEVAGHVYATRITVTKRPGLNSFVQVDFEPIKGWLDASYIYLLTRQHDNRFKIRSLDRNREL